MKVLVIVALFAFVAVQVCQSAPVPEDDKADKPADLTKEEPAAAALPAADSPVPADAAAVAPVTEPKTEQASPVAVAKAVEDAAAPQAEEKKE